MDTLSAFEFIRVALGLVVVWKCFSGVRRTRGDVRGAFLWKPQGQAQHVERERRLVRMRSMNRRYHRYGIGATGLLAAGLLAAFTPGGPETLLSATSNIAQILALGVFYVLADGDEDQRDQILALRGAQGLSLTDQSESSQAPPDQEGQ